MLNDSRTLLDPATASPSPIAVDGEGVLIGGRYRLSHPIGEGGMGNVYLAEDLVLARQVAIKTVRAELSNNEEVRARIKRECRLHAAIGAHPHIITLYDSIEEKGHLYLVMEYFEGETLAARLAANGGQPLPLPMALDIVRQLLLALACIHGRDIVHRDIKSSNILLTARGDGGFLAKLTDFGIAQADIDPLALTRLTAMDTQGPGTPIYMAPERIDAQTFGPVCPASDLYAVGILLFELLSGAPPFTGTTTEIFSGHLLRQPQLEALSSGLPEQLFTVLRTALTKQPKERYQSAEAFLEALAGVPAGVLPAHPQPVPPPDATLLAIDVQTPTGAGGGETVLHPALARSRGQSVAAHGRRAWMYGAAVIVLVLTGYLVHRHMADTPQPTAGQAAVAEATASAPRDPAAAPKPDEPAMTAPPKEASALATVEQARQQSRESMAAARNENGQAGEWQVTENRTRKIH